MELYINRYLLLQQRLRRRKGWYKPAIVDATSQDYIEVAWPLMWPPDWQLIHLLHRLAWIWGRRKALSSDANQCSA